MGDGRPPALATEREEPRVANRERSARPFVIAGAAALGGAAIVLLVVFKPWLLLVNVRVDDALPPGGAPTASAPADPSAPTATADPLPVQLYSGQFISHEHETSGTARIIENPDGTRVLALENLSTSSGPDVHVWLSAADAVPGREGWGLAGSAAYLDLGSIKGNLGNQVYEIPAGADLDGFRSVSLWCVQFSVSFGAAQLD
jgi:hypothetical protein